MMLLLKARPPASYELCNQTVTIYHTDGQTYSRTVRHDAFLDQKKVQSVDKTGSREASSFLLVLPGATVPVSVGDKVVPGEGPACNSREDWVALIPTKVPGLVVVQYVDVKRFGGEIVHTEAGG